MYKYSDPTVFNKIFLKLKETLQISHVSKYNNNNMTYVSCGKKFTAQ